MPPVTRTVRKPKSSALRSRWESMFRSAGQEGVKADGFRPTGELILTRLAVGVLPAIALGPLSVAAAVAGTMAATPKGRTS